MMPRLEGKGLTADLHKASVAYVAKFGGTPAEALAVLLAVKERSAHVKKPQAVTLDDGILVVTCDLCEDEEWWQENFDGIWEAARWYYCGPLGAECPCCV